MALSCSSAWSCVHCSASHAEYCNATCAFSRWCTLVIPTPGVSRLDTGQYTWHWHYCIVLCLAVGMIPTAVLQSLAAAVSAPPFILGTGGCLFFSHPLFTMLTGPFIGAARAAVATPPRASPYLGVALMTLTSQHTSAGTTCPAHPWTCGWHWQGHR